MDDMRFQRKASFTPAEFQELANKVSTYL
jgi:hypothetical protein